VESCYLGGMAKITTVQDFIDNDMSLSIWCVACQKGGGLNLLKVKLKWGGDLNIYDEKNRPFSCPRCGGKVSISIGGAGAHRARGITRG
jgi:hypothetical protein